MEKIISVVIKVTNGCNLNCKYCYDADNKQKTFIKKEQISKLFDILTENFEEIQVIWHGGEPLLMGIDFYKWVVEKEKSYSNIFHNHMQTNGILLNDEYAKFLVENNFHIGMSYDGGDEISGRPLQDKTFEARKLVTKYGGKCGFVNVVNANNIDKLEDLYEFYKKENIGVNFNCVFPSGRIINEKNENLLISPQQFTNKMKILFEKWLLEDDTHNKIAPLNDYLNAYLGTCRKCLVNSCLFKWLCMDSFGNLHPCGRVLNEEFILGNIDEITNFSEIYDNDAYKKLVEGAIKRREKCKSCNVYKYCNGGCNSDALLYGNLEDNHHNACIVNKAMFTYAADAFDKIIKSEKICNNKYIIKRLKEKYQF